MEPLLAEAVTVRVGIIGAGMIGTQHARRLVTQVAGCTVTAVADVVTPRAAALAAEVGAAVCWTWQDLVADPQVDAVLVASPGQAHVDQVLAAVAAGKPVFCEKPLAPAAADALRVVAAEAAAGRRIVTVGFMRRYDAGYRDLKAAIEGGEIGEPLLAHAIHRNASVPEGFVGEMSITDSLVHEFDAFRWLLQQEVVAATVVGVRRSPLAPAHLVDPRIVLLEFANGAVLDAESFVTSGYGYDVRCEVVGSRGTAALDHPRATVILSDGRRAEAVPADWSVRFGQAYRDELRGWVAALAGSGAGGSAVPVGAADAWDGYAAAAVAEAAVAAHRAGARTAVTLAAIPAMYR